MRPSQYLYRIPVFAGMMIFFLIGLGIPQAGAGEVPHHDITVVLNPEKHRLTAIDTITLPKDHPREFVFALHAGLNPSFQEPDIRIRKRSTQEGPVPLEVFNVTLPEDANRVTLKYAGQIYHPLIISKNQARGFDETPGSIADEGVYLAASSAWYPLLETDFFTFTLTVELPEKWTAVSQGSRMAQEKTGSGMKIGWDSPESQNDIYLIASRFTVYEKTSDTLSAMVFLRKPEEALAGKYLDATLRYVGMYDKLIGPYPYKKFALVENFWETGFGMPSFTLLGPTVLRLPFIINTSYPHEILHNWWGNSVYPVYQKGNWSEGLTAYLADHLLKEQQGGGPEYRLNTLQKYSDYVSSGRDFPLTQFTSRHSQSTEAVGYGKSLMFFHMLRLDLGEKAFIGGLRHFYQNFKFRFATYDDLQKSFEIVSGKDLKHAFSQWVRETGAPRIRLENVQSKKDGKSYALGGRLRQVQQGKPYALRIPVAVTMEGGGNAFQAVLELNEKEKEFKLNVPAQPLRIDIDPEFDVFRRLDLGETPPAITQALGAKKMLVVLPAAASKELLKAYKSLAETLLHSGPDEVEVKLDNDMRKLPQDRAVAVLGWENRFAERTFADWKQYDASITRKSVIIGKNEIMKDNHAFVLTARHAESKENALLFIAADRAQALPGLARKLPHYHKYSYLAFEGDEPANIAKGRWPVVNSPLTVILKDKAGRSSPAEMGKLAPREALASLPPAYSEKRMMETVTFLSDDRLKGRETGTPGIDQAAEYIAGKFKQAGLLPGGDNGSFFQKWQESDSSSPALEKRGGATLTLRNVIGVIPGKKQDFTGQSVVVGAHYDHLGQGSTLARTEDQGKIHPGADDNASGVAILVELATVLKENLHPDRSIVFTAFSGEEEGKLGSLHYVKHEKQYPAAKSMGMINLDTVGRLGKRKVLIIGAGSAKEWVHIFRGAGFVTGVDIDVVSEELDSSDQKSFHEAGVPAVQIFSGPHLDYHRPTDTADKIDMAGMIKIASVTKEAIEYLAAREEPLTSTLKAGESKPAPKSERKVSLGTIPDFAYTGQGLRLSGVVPRSPAEAAGLKEGDVIIELNSTVISSLKGFSDILKTLKPGDKALITFERDGKRSKAQAEVKAR